MYLRRIQLENYGPIRSLDIRFPFEADRPKPVLLVGENGSGKTIVLSHIVNAMISAKDAVYQESGEMEAGKAFKLRSSSYISVGAEYYFARVDFNSDLFVQEMRLRQPKSAYTDAPMGSHESAFEAWNSDFQETGFDYFKTNIRPSPPGSNGVVSPLVSANCLLYFPSNRMEEPAWLNKANLRTRPQYTTGPRISGKTGRRIVAHSPLRDIHNWLYDVAYDRAAFEILSRQANVPIGSESGDTARATVPVPLFLGY